MIFPWARHRGSAPIARDRLKILLTHERTLNSRPELLARLHSDIVAVICRHVTVSPEEVQVKMDRGETVSRLNIDIALPASTAVST
jgi:cell division topological specificity factor